MSPATKKFNRVRKGSKILNQHDQVQLFLAIVKKTDGTVINTVEGFEKALDNYSSYKYHDIVTLRAFNKEFDESTYKGDIRRFHDKLRGVNIFYDFVKRLRENASYEWDKEFFDDIIEYAGADHLAKRAADSAINFSLSSPKIDSLVGREFRLYTLTKPDAHFSNLDPDVFKGKPIGILRFKTLVEVDLLMYRPKQNGVFGYPGKYKFNYEENSLLVEIGTVHPIGTELTMFFTLTENNVSEKMFGRFLVVDKAGAIPVVMRELLVEGILPSEFDPNVKVKIPESLHNTFEINQKKNVMRALLSEFFWENGTLIFLLFISYPIYKLLKTKSYLNPFENGQTVGWLFTILLCVAGIFFHRRGKKIYDEVRIEYTKPKDIDAVFY